MNALAEIAAVVEEALSTLPEADRELGRDVAMDVAKIAARAMQGEDVATETVHVHSQAVSLAASVRVRLENGIIDGIMRVVQRTVRGALVG